jgi:hypothetical protein
VFETVNKGIDRAAEDDIGILIGKGFELKIINAVTFVLLVLTSLQDFPSDDKCLKHRRGVPSEKTWFDH